MNYQDFNCSTFQNELPDLVLTPGAVPSPAMQAHMVSCIPCADEYLSFQSTFAVLDQWTAPEPTAYFDQKLAVRLREEHSAPPMSWLERLATSFNLNSGRNLRPMLAGALALALAVGGGSLFTADYTSQPHGAPVAAAVSDLQILDRNDQAFQQMDLLQQDATDSNAQQAPAPAAVPES